MAKIKPVTKSRIVEKIEAVPIAGCWIWTGTITSRGYGQLLSNNKKMYAHRAAFEAFVGDIPEGMVVCHTCDNVHCVNPDHLFLGTQKDNLQDMKEKGRSTAGEKNKQSKLSEDDVKAIKHWLNHGVSEYQLSKSFDVSRSAINAIKLGKSWSHVE
jgi:hypothetical protein